MFRIIAVFLSFLKGAAVMEKIIFEPEKKMWEAAAERNKETFLQLVSPEAVMVCGGFRCSGAEYAGFIGDFCISSFEMQDFETIVETPTLVQVHYVVRTTADTPENADLAGLFHVTSTWQKRGESWVLVFNMDSRIIEG